LQDRSGSIVPARVLRGGKPEPERTIPSDLARRGMPVPATRTHAHPGPAMFSLPPGEPPMPSLDVVSRVDYSEIDNALNNTKKALMQRFDFRGSAYEIAVDKKEKKLSLNAEDGTKLGAIRETFFTHALRRGLNVKSFEVEEPLPGAGGNVKQTCKIREGLEGDLAKKTSSSSRKTSSRSRPRSSATRSGSPPSPSTTSAPRWPCSTPRTSKSRCNLST